MSIISFAIDHAADIVEIGGLVYGALFAKKKVTEKKQDRAALGKKLTTAARKAFAQLLNDPRIYNDAWVCEQLEKAMRSALDALGVKSNKAINKVIDLAVHDLHDELAERLWDHHFGKLATTLEQTNETLKSAL